MTPPTGGVFYWNGGQGGYDTHLMEKRYQVFVSSTYADLKEERHNVIQTLMEMDCIPAGMELFPAVDEEQYEFIKRVIDDCDYYLVIVGGRYGSITKEGISYTEKEYDYAVEKGLKVIAFLHEKPEEIAVGKSELDPSLRAKLEEFRNKLSNGRLVKFWSKADELPGLVAVNLSKTIKMYPAIGWMRANKTTNEQLFSEINDLQKENKNLKEKVVAKELTPSIANLAGLDAEFEIHGTYEERGYGNSYYKKSWQWNLTWNEIFGFIAPSLLGHPNDKTVELHLERLAKQKLGLGGQSYSINTEDFETIKLQLKAQGLVEIKYSKTVQGGMALFWFMTSAGERLMMQLRTVKA